VAEQGQRDFEPGTSTSYSNTGYVLLGRIIEKITETPITRYMEDQIFKPLGMNDTFIYDENRPQIPRLARAYKILDDGAIYQRSPGTVTVGDGGVCSTLQDLARWNRAMEGQQTLVSAETLQAIFTRQTLADGTAINRGLGVYMPPGTDPVAYTNEGEDNGNHAIYLRLPGEKVSMVLLSNASIDWNKIYTVARSLTERYCGREVAEKLQF